MDEQNLTPQAPETVMESSAQGITPLHAAENGALLDEAANQGPVPASVSAAPPPLPDSVSQASLVPPEAEAPVPPPLPSDAAEATPAAAPATPTQEEEAEPCPLFPEITLSFQIDQTARIRVGESITRLGDKIQSVRLPLSQIGQAFSFRLDLSDIPGLILDHVSAMDFDKIGLVVEMERGGLSIHGVPCREFNGNIDIKINHMLKMAMTKDFHVNPDPRSLWKEIEPSDDGGYPKDHLASAGALIPGGKRLVAASRRGRSHAHEAKFREDAFHYEIDEATDWIYLAVADGAGSAKFSRKGSDLACQESVRLLRENFSKIPQEELQADLQAWSADPNNQELSRSKREKTQLDAIFHRSIYFTWMKIKEEADARQATMRDYYTTLLLAVLKKFEFGWFMASYWVGDGAIAIYLPNINPEIRVLGKPDGGEFAGQTKFLTMKEEIDENAIKSRMRYSFMSDFKAIMLMSDGVSDPFFEAEADLFKIERWYKLWQDIDQAVNLSKAGDPEQCAAPLAEWLNFWSKGNHDDRSIMILY